MIYLEDKVKIVSNLDDHKGYKKGQVVEVIAMDDDGMITVEGANGTQWYLDSEEVELVKKGARKFADGSTVNEEVKDYVVMGSVSTNKFSENFSKIIPNYSEYEAIQRVKNATKHIYAKKFKVKESELKWNLSARERGKYAKGTTVKGGGNKYYVIDAKSGDVVSKGFDTEEEAKVEKFKIFEENGNFFLTQKKMSKGSTVKSLKPIKVKAYGMDKSIVNLTQKAIDFLQKKFPQYRGEEELDSTEPYWDMVDAVRENFDTDTPTKYGEIGEEIVRMYLDKENKYANGGSTSIGYSYSIGGL